MQDHRTAEAITSTIRNYLERKRVIEDKSPKWEVKKSELGGFGIFATCHIQPGDIILRDFPVILGPRAVRDCPPVCVNCYHKDNLIQCSRKCGLSVCSESCQNSDLHRKECDIITRWITRPITEDLYPEVLQVLSPIRSLLLSKDDKLVVSCLKFHRLDQHGFEVDVMKEKLGFSLTSDEDLFLRYMCSVMDSNAFEVVVGNEAHQTSVKGLYPLGSLANHSCTPNASHVFDEDQHMVVKAAVEIPPGTEICHSYSRLIWGTPTRRFHLSRTKHFICRCKRCADPTEFGAYLSAFMCRNCKKGRVILAEPLRTLGKWRCDLCESTFGGPHIASITSILGSALKRLDQEDFDFRLRFMKEKLGSLVPETNETIVEMKYKIIWAVGHQAGFGWAEIPLDLLVTKEMFCTDMLALLGTLKLGQCKMRGLLLYELYCTVRELQKRRELIEAHPPKRHLQIEALMTEAEEILRFDVSAPDEIKQIFKDRNNNTLQQSLNNS